MSALNIYPVYQWTTGNTMTATLLNNPLAAIQTWSTKIDNTNLTGGAGIFASQVIPLNVTQATFGGAVGYTFAPGSTTQVALIASGVAGQAVDIFQVTLTAGGTKAISVSSTGALVFPAATTAGSAGQIWVGTDSANNGLFFNVATGSTNGFRFGTNNATTFQIDRLGVACFASAGASTMPALPSIVGSGGGGLVLNNAVGQNFFFTSGVAAVNALANINGTSGNYTATSDKRLKENVADLELGLDALLKLRPVSYDWINSRTPGQGFIAQEVQEVVPLAVSAVSEDCDTLGISDALLTPVVVKALQQFYAEFQAYKAAHP